MLHNLWAEMNRLGITTEDVARTLNVNRKTAYNKIRGMSPFKIPEARIIQKTYFPQYTIEYLFEQKEDESGEK